MRHRYLVSISALAFLGSGCGPTPPPSITIQTDSQTPLVNNLDANQVEPTVAVIPQHVNASCDQGRIFVSYGDLGNVRVKSTNIQCALDYGSECFDAPENLPELAFINGSTTVPDTIPIAPLPAVPTHVLLTDAPTAAPCPTPTGANTIPRDNLAWTNQYIARVNGSEVLQVALENRAHTPKQPQPNGQTDAMGNNLADCYTPFITSSLSISKSTDCGATWTKRNVFDVADASQFPLSYVLTEYDPSGNPQGSPPFALDRPELYIDETTLASSGKTDVLLTASTRVGVNSGTQWLFHSFDGGDTWQPPVALPSVFNSSPTTNGIDEPAMMAVNTATLFPAGDHRRIFLFKCEQGPLLTPTPFFVPTLWWSDDDGLTFVGDGTAPHGGTDVSYKVYDTSTPPNVIGSIPCNYLPNSRLPDGSFESNSGHGIVPFGPGGGVLVTYPGLDSATNTFQVAAATVVTFPRVDTPSVTDSNLIDESASSKHVIQASLVRAEHQDTWTLGSWSDAAVWYWYSAAAVTTSFSVTTEYAVVHDGIIWTSPAQLAVFPPMGTYGWNFFKTSAPGAVSQYPGDFHRGAFFFGDTSDGPEGTGELPRFFVPWVESNPNLLSYNSALHANMVTLHLAMFRGVPLVLVFSAASCGGQTSVPVGSTNTAAGGAGGTSSIGTGGAMSAAGGALDAGASGQAGAAQAGSPGLGGVGGSAAGDAGAGGEQAGQSGAGGNTSVGGAPAGASGAAGAGAVCTYHNGDYPPSGGCLLNPCPSTYDCCSNYCFTDKCTKFCTGNGADPQACMGCLAKTFCTTKGTCPEAGIVYPKDGGLKTTRVEFPRRLCSAIDRRALPEAEN